MSSQFVDIDGDGLKDILVGSFEGVPFLIRASQQGYMPAERILDENNETVLLSDFWNREDNKWDKTDRAGVEGHCTSAHAVDWTGNGVLDLLLGDYYGGRLYWRENVGTATEPKFAATSQPVMAGDQPVVVTGGLSAPIAVDFNGDGLFDILLGGSKGGVYYLENIGEAGQPRFAALKTLVPPVPNPRNSYMTEVPVVDGLPAYPGSSWHIELVDYNGNGKLDLLVGARAAWQPEVEPLTEAQLAEKEQLQESAREFDQQFRELALELQRIQEESEEQDVEAQEAAIKPLMERFQELATERRQVQLRLTEMGAGGPKQGDFVWWFPRK